MLKGLILCTPGEKEWRDRLLKEGLPWVVADPMTEETLHESMKLLQAGSEEVLCLVETNAQEQMIVKNGLKCAGLLHPLSGQASLPDCEILLEGLEEADRPFWEAVHARAFGRPVQIAKTQHLILRELTLEDLPELVKLYEEKEREAFFPEWSEDYQELEERISSYIKNMYSFYCFGMWVIIEKASGKLIGRAGFGLADYLESSEVDLGYYIGAAYRGRGLAKEACEAVLAYGRERLDFQTCSAYIEAENEPSLALIEKLGFSKEREFEHQGRLIYRYELHF